MKKLDSTYELVLEAILTSGKTCKEILDMLKLLENMRSAYMDKRQRGKIDSDLAWQRGWLDCMDRMRELRDDN